jgi:hypothetical protein
MHSWKNFGAWMNYEHTQTHKTHHGLDLGETTTFPRITFFVAHHKGYTQMHFSQDSQIGNPTIPKIGILAILDAHNFLCKLSNKMKSKTNF